MKFNLRNFILRSDDADSFIPEWDEFITGDGNLFYMEYHLNQELLKLQALKLKNGFMDARNEFKRNSMRRSKKATGKLSKLISRRSHKKDNKNVSNATANTSAASSSLSKFVPSKVKFGELNEGEIKHVPIHIDPSAQHNFGRRTTMCEAICGLSICTFPESANVMVAGFTANNVAGQHVGRSIKVGDWLKAIDGQEVTIDTINSVLMRYIAPTKIVLTLQRTAAEEQFQDETESYRVGNLDEFAESSREMFGVPEQMMTGEAGTSAVVNVLYLTLNKNDDDDGMDGDGRDVLFAYPAKERNGN